MTANLVAVTPVDADAPAIIRPSPGLGWPAGSRPSHARRGQLTGSLETLIGSLELGAKVSTA